MKLRFLCAFALIMVIGVGNIGSGSDDAPVSQHGLDNGVDGALKKAEQKLQNRAYFDTARLN